MAGRAPRRRTLAGTHQQQRLAFDRPPRDGDHDGKVFDGTPQERAASARPLPPKASRVEASRQRVAARIQAVRQRIADREQLGAKVEDPDHPDYGYQFDPDANRGRFPGPARHVGYNLGFETARKLVLGTRAERSEARRVLARYRASARGQSGGTTDFHSDFDLGMRSVADERLHQVPRLTRRLRRLRAAHERLGE